MSLNFINIDQAEMFDDVSWRPLPRREPIWKDKSVHNPAEAITLLAELVARNSDCEYIHCGREFGWTCLDEQTWALEHPGEYAPEYRRRILDGGELCDGCQAKQLLIALGMVSSIDGGKG